MNTGNSARTNMCNMYLCRCYKGLVAYQLLNNPGNDVGIVHSPPVIGPDRPNVHARLVIPVGQEAI